MFFPGAFRALLLGGSVLQIHSQDIFEAAEATPTDYTESINITDEHLVNAHADMDANSNKEVSSEELLNFTETHHKEVAMGKLNMSEVMGEMDTNGNGEVSLDEHLADVVPAEVSLGEHLAESEKDRKQKIEDATELFKAADANSDGHLDKDELSILKAPEAFYGDGHYLMESTALITVRMQHVFRDADTDGDGHVSFGEFQQSDLSWGEYWRDEDKLFNRVDVNGDGTISQEELRPLVNGIIEREGMVDNMVTKLDKNSNSHIDSRELVQGKTAVQDSDLQDYLVAWAKRRQLFTWSPQHPSHTQAPFLWPPTHFGFYSDDEVLAAVDIPDIPGQNRS